jgi:hypothetical protein
MPPIMIDILKTTPPSRHGAAAARLVGRFTTPATSSSSASSIRWRRWWRMWGFPLGCAPIVNSFLFRSAASAANSFYKAMEGTVEAGDPGSILLGVDDGGSQAPVPPGPEAGESVTTTPCGHRFHRSCLDRWTAVNRSVRPQVPSCLFSPSLLLKG